MVQETGREIGFPCSQERRKKIVSSNFAKNTSWKKGVWDPPHCLTSVILTPAWIPPPSYVDWLPGSSNQSKVYRYNDLILEVSSGKETTFLYVANPSCLYPNVIVHFHKISQCFARSVKTNLRSSLDEFIHQMNSHHYMNLPWHTPVVHLWSKQCTKPELKYNLSQKYSNCSH